MTTSDKVHLDGQYELKTYTPHEREVVGAVISIWKEDPSTEALGIAKLHSIVKEKHSNWSVSEKRMKSLLKKFGLSPNLAAEQYTYAKHITSQPTPNLDLPDAINLVMTAKRGKSLYAKSNIAKGELIWEEKPMFLVPLLAHAELIATGKACTHCGKLANDASRSKAGVSVLRGLDCNICLEVWCSLLCKKVNLLLHSALKHGSRASKKMIDADAYERLVDYCIKEQWNALYSICGIYAEMLTDKDGIKKKQFEAMARVSQKIRYKSMDSSSGNFDSMQGGALFVEEQQELMWEKGYLLFCDVFPSAIDKYNMDFEEFLFILGTYNINNLDSSIYLVQSHLNHNCEPNVNVETLPRKSEGLKVFAHRDIKAGEELTTSYVNPAHSVNQRQRDLRVNWGFVCNCKKCKSDLNLQQQQVSEHKATNKDQVNAETKNLTPDQSLGSHEELLNMLKFGRERRKSVRFDDAVVKVA